MIYGLIVIPTVKKIIKLGINFDVQMHKTSNVVGNKIQINKSSNTKSTNVVYIAQTMKVRGELEKENMQ